MAKITASLPLTASPSIPKPIIDSISCCSLPISTSSFASRSFSSRLNPTISHCIKQNRRHLAFTPLHSLSDRDSPFPLSETLIPSGFPSHYLPSITPLAVCKYAAVIALSIAAAKKAAEILRSPFFWVYFSWTWLFWPWILASSLALYGVYSAKRHSIGQASVIEQLAVVTSTITWLTLVPPAHFNGFLEGWPFVLFFVYHYFFFFESSVRKRLYGDLLPRAHDPKWDIGLPRTFRIGFLVLVLMGHWLAAYEGPELHLISGGWANFGTWLLITISLFMRYHSVLYLAKYSEKVVVPTAVVQFGPYRWVRHPIYASTMLLFAIHCISLRAPLTLLFMVAVCLIYYGKKAELEEVIMVESFGDRYREYMKKVKYRLIPFLY